MVQRKVPNKLGIQAHDHVKPEKRLGNLKPNSCQHQDGKNRGPDMKKKMKRSRSIKLSDIESLKSSSPLRKSMSQPGKPPPPPLNAPTTEATPQKQLMIKTTDGSPNYMKSTSSSEARKERSLVSPLNTQSGSNGQNLHRRNSGSSKFSPASSNKQARTLSKTSSLKLVRTPSFKPTRGAAKRCSRVALCADVSAQTATCSSTLKDSKFPPYLMLNPGGTESEGISVKKVCPYSYCSLNGHHHKPVPPLKCFLKARRHSLKVQKSIKWEVLSPRRARPSGEGTEEIHGDKPMIQETGKDFFIEIFSKKNTEDSAFSGEPERRINESCFYTSHEGAAEQDSNNQVSESLPDESQESELDFEENSSNTNEPEMDVTGVEDERDGDTDCSSTLSEEEAIMRSCENRSDIEGECQASMDEDDNISEATDMEWEEGQLSTSKVVTEADYLNKPDEDEFCTKVEGTPGIKRLDWQGDSEIIISDNAVSNCTEEILADEILQELFAEETAYIDMQCSDSDSESDGILHYWEILESIQGARDLAYDQESSAEDASEALKTEEAREKIHEEGVHEMENDVNETHPQLGDDENDCTTDISAEVLNGHQEDTSLQTDHATMLQNQIADSPRISDKMDMVRTNKEDSIDQQIEVAENNQDFAISEIPYGEAGDATEDREQVANAELTFEIHVSDSPQSFSEADQDDAELNDDGNHMTTEACQLDVTVEDSSSSQDLVAHSTPTEPHNHQLDEHDETTNVLESQNLSDEDQDEANKIKILTAMDFEAQSDSRMHKINLTRDDTGDVEKTEVEVCNKSDTAETLLSANNGTSTGSKRPFLYTRGNPDQELDDTCNNRKWTFGDKKPIVDLEEEREFNPREPNFLPVVSDPEAEKVDLRHQMMDERKNSEEWMIDYALRQTVTKLAPARKRKVALLVEAFEKVLPTPKYETRIRHAPAAFSHTRPIQACR